MIGIEFLEISKKAFSFLENENQFFIAEQYAENDGKSDWLIYRSNNRAIKIIYDWHDEYVYVIIFNINKETAELPNLGEAEKILYLENLLKYKNIMFDNLLHGDFNNYKTAISNAAKLVFENASDIINGKMWLSNFDLLKS